MTEHELQKAILEFLAYQRGCYCWRNNTGAFAGTYTRKRDGITKNRFIKFSEAGAADVFFVKAGKFFAIECKGKKGAQSEDQAEWQKKIEQAGAVYMLFNDLDIFMQWFKTI